LGDSFLFYILYLGRIRRGTAAENSVSRHRLGEAEIFEFHNVLDVTYGAYVVNGAYSANNAATGKNRGEAVAIIRELVRGNTADIYRRAREASTAICIVQTFTAATDSIADKLGTMNELARKASGSDYSQVQVEEMQEEFQGLAKEINGTARNTEYNYNKLLSSEGEAISIYVSNSFKIDIFASDLSFDAEGLDLTADPHTALSRMEEAREKLSEYNTYLTRQATRLEDATAIIEGKLESAFGVDTSDFTVEFGSQVRSNPARQILENRSALLDMQANVTPARALQLLKEQN